MLPKGEVLLSSVWRRDLRRPEWSWIDELVTHCRWAWERTSKHYIMLVMCQALFSEISLSSLIFPHFTEKQTKCWESLRNVPDHILSKWQRRGSHTSSHTPKSMLLMTVLCFLWKIWQKNCESWYWKDFPISAIPTHTYKMCEWVHINTYSLIFVHTDVSQSNIPSDGLKLKIEPMGQANMETRVWFKHIY